jgi:hypothetical protein
MVSVLDVFVEVFCKGVNSSLEGCCFGGGLAVGLAQSHLFQCHLVHLFCQVVEFVEDCLEGAFHFVSDCACVLLDEPFKVGSYCHIGCAVLKDVFSTAVDFCPEDATYDRTDSAAAESTYSRTTRQR